MFKKCKENFKCYNCKTLVYGTGYTDHCPNCLWSKHVDIKPGDRQAKCNGKMKPIAVEVKTKKYIIYYQCIKCNYKYRVKASSFDNMTEIIKLSSKQFF